MVILFSAQSKGINLNVPLCLHTIVEQILNYLCRKNCSPEGQFPVTDSV